MKGLKRISDTVWEIPVSYKEGMRVPARIYGTEKIIQELDEAVYDQVTNVATLPGITKYALCMPDGHFGYGFPIGGVAAMDVDQGGVISPGGIGFDINCGMRLLVTNLTYDEVKPRIKKLVDKLYQRVPAGVGSTGFVKISRQEFRQVVEEGAGWCLRNGYGWEEDLELIEENGCMKGADASKISEKAIDRGFNQIGTLGSGNHYLEIQVARKEHIFDRDLARTMGITRPDQVVVMFHCGSRGFGHQVATDYLQVFLKVMESKYGIKILDRELACAPLNSPEGQAYFAAMKCGINMSYVNRQVILHRIREVFSEIFGSSAEDLGMHMVYDVAHNTAKLERHVVDGKERSLLVHRKGATRAFGPGMEDVPERYQEIGQPVIIGGSMETGSYLLVGVPTGDQTFFSTAHGSGRTMSRTKARKTWQGDQLQRDMLRKGIYVRSTSKTGLAEEAGGAYKDIEDVIEAAELAGISKRVVRLTPIGNVKG
ncbi:MAG: RtcB family protein [Symplocastrum torsivum CPER-KK1]|uniref:tRNA-splicing ligase RtcB n=1 Tax=Symplocastrum torsivum CPER-KK1 TaxID=450513 RepID=A0A951UAV0_9CYAN|nr:RtcB family protein [Symplocastrum torsivum CPER-KK1]